MHNRFFDEDHLRVLLHPERWRLVGPPGFFSYPGLPRKSTGRPPEHTESHPYAEFVIMLRGHGRYWLGGRWCEATPGTVFVIPACVPHQAAYRPQSTDSTHLWLRAPGDCMTGHVIQRRRVGTVQKLSSPIVLTGADVGMNARQQIVLIQSHETPQPLRRSRCLGAVALAVSAAVAVGFRAEGQIDHDRAARAVVLAVQQHLSDHLSHATSLDDLARLAGYSKFHLLRLFKRQTGQTIHAYVDQCRASRLRELESRGLLCKEVAAALGFAGPQSFCRWRRRHAGVRAEVRLPRKRRVKKAQG